MTHFLKNQDPEFESRRAAFCHQESLPTMDEAVSAMIDEESRLRVMGSSNSMKPAYVTVEDREQPQPEQVAAPVPHPSPNSSPGSSPVPTGNIPSNIEHVELPLAQRKDPRANAGKPPSRYGFDHDIAMSHTLVSHLHIELLLHLFKQCLFRRIGGVLNRIRSGRRQ